MGSLPLVPFPWFPSLGSLPLGFISPGFPFCQVPSLISISLGFPSCLLPCLPACLLQFPPCQPPFPWFLPSMPTFPWFLPSLSDCLHQKSWCLKFATSLLGLICGSLHICTIQVVTGTIGYTVLQLYAFAGPNDN